MKTLRYAFALGSFLLLSPTSPAVAGSAGGYATQSVDDFTIVDCQVRPRIKQLGRNVRYASARRPQKMTARECELQGGEYVVFDPSRPNDAISMWLPEAEQGDVQAQTNVGELYERSNPPNYAAAASWYRRAADQGHRPAMLSLGRLHEAGLGVQRDPSTALHWYRQALGGQINGAGLVAASATSGTRTGGVSASPSYGTQAGQDGPKIEILFPPVPTTRGDVRIRRRGNDGNLGIVGRVSPPNDIARVEVNRQSVAVEPGGVFRVALGTAQAEARVSILAQDRRGRTDQLEVIVEPDAQASRSRPRPPAALGSGRNVALVVGNNRYRYWEPLDNSTRDAQAIARVLQQRYGFETRLLLDTDRAQVLSAINEYRKQLTENDNFLLYYAGHGYLEQMTDRGFWIPIDGQTDGDTFWIANYSITDQLKLMRAKHVLVIADSCYAGTLSQSALVGVEPDIDEMQRVSVLEGFAQRRVRLAMTSGGVSPVLDEGVNGHSVFAWALLQALESNAAPLEGYKLFQAIQAQVRSQAAKRGVRQIPTYAPINASDHEVGDFVFVPRG